MDSDIPYTDILKGHMEASGTKFTPSEAAGPYTSPSFMHGMLLSGMEASPISFVLMEVKLISFQDPRK